MLFEDVTIAVQPCAAAPKDESPVLCFQPGQVLLVEKESVPCLPDRRSLRPIRWGTRSSPKETACPMGRCGCFGKWTAAPALC